MKDNHGFKFTCTSCGDHNLIVNHIWNIQTGNNSERWQECGRLKEKHHWQSESKEKIDNHAEADRRGLIMPVEFSDFIPAES